MKNFTEHPILDDDFGSLCEADVGTPLICASNGVASLVGVYKNQNCKSRSLDTKGTKTSPAIYVSVLKARLGTRTYLHTLAGILRSYLIDL